METRSRKRAEATSSAPSPSSPQSAAAGPTTRSAKRIRLTASSAAPTAPATRSRANRSRDSLPPPPPSTATPMDPTTESSGSRRDRRRNNQDNSDKGKEKEHEIRARDKDRDADKNSGLNIDREANCEDDDNDSEAGFGIMSHNLTSASSALQGLLRKLGAGLDDLLPATMGSASSSHQSGRLKKILSGLRADGEEGKQVEALTQLCEILSIGTEDSLSTFSVDSFVPVLVGLLNHESNPDIMLLAARALTHLCDVLPSSCAAVVHYGAVSCFCARLLTIEYMDLAEQSLQALKKISQEHPTACLRAGALMAVLSYLDFFSTGVQRVALSTAANMCRKLPSDAADFVMEAVPLLTNLLQYHDSKVLEHASVCLTRIAEAFTSSPDKLDELCNHGLVTQAAALISSSNAGSAQTFLSTSTYTGLIRILATCASGSPLGAKTLLLLGISGTLQDILSGSGVFANGSVPPALSRPPEQSGSSNPIVDGQSNRTSLLDSILQAELPCELEKTNATYNILALLRVLEGLNQLAPRLRAQLILDNYAKGEISSLDEMNGISTRVPSEEFINGKLTPKLSRQIQDALALCSGSLPAWTAQLIKACPFLFPFETRRQYFYSTAFGLSRALYRLQQQQGAESHGLTNEREFRVARLHRQKVRVSRNRILDSAIKVMEMYCGQRAVLEVEYFGEVGTGLGPTLEFYTLLSQELQKAELEMWRSISSSLKKLDDADLNKETVGKKNGEYVHAPLGLFPCPWSPNSDNSDGNKFSKVIEYFRLVGRVMAKALQDGRLLDLSLSPAFFKTVLGEELDLHDVRSFDAELGKVLEELHAIVCRKRYLESVDGDNPDAVMDLRFRGVRIEDLCLDFTLPGHPDYVLKPGDELVDIYNLEEYVSLVVDATLRAGIARQLEAFKSGFNQVFDISCLQLFTPSELDYLLCGRRELWKAETLAEHIKFDHGYTAKSPAIISLLEIMVDFTPEQQRAFCQFVTGAPRLPPGGLAVLNPKLTIVRKQSSSASNASGNGNAPSESADDDLPSVMTCANYLKLPPYSTKEVMYKKLLYAINEGQGSFDLS
ncbi:hypothetical protein SAY86_013720 [Trapa natans]|uniref:HECT-type E3 ubiquitin transferase n=1 Tax=Trapa natans TaxID=22666 RepID=A0AAN7KS06_TRANT|nr:hypothetical protein SAY86_013720 [Trapa natans]